MHFMQGLRLLTTMILKVSSDPNSILKFDLLVPFLSLDSKASVDNHNGDI